MEALQTQVDNLQWEVNRLEAENKSLRAQHTEASKRVDLELKVMKELQSLQEVLAAKEAKFIQTSTEKEQELEETVAKLQVAESELEKQQKKQNELYEGETKQLIKHLKQLQRTTERDHENSELIHYRALYS